MRAAPAFACLRDGAAVVGIILQYGFGVGILFALVIVKTSKTLN
jgi:hypothetical protein